MPVRKKAEPAAKTPTGKLTKSQRPLRPAPSIEHAIASRAYQLFTERGGVHGHDWEDWLSAERELMSAAS